MRLQVLVSAVGQEPEELISRMKLQSDAIIINQARANRYHKLTRDGHESCI